MDVVTEAERSGGSAFFPINDLALSRHCSASCNIRSTSTATMSRSSEARTERKKTEDDSWMINEAGLLHKRSHMTSECKQSATVFN